MFLFQLFVSLTCTYTLKSGATITNVVYNRNSNPVVAVQQSSAPAGSFVVLPSSYVSSVFTMDTNQFLTYNDIPVSLQVSATLMVDDDVDTIMTIGDFATYTFDIPNDTYSGFREYSVSGFIADNDCNVILKLDNYLRFEHWYNDHFAISQFGYYALGPNPAGSNEYCDIWWDFGTGDTGVWNKPVLEFSLMADDYVNAVIGASYQDGYNAGWSVGQEVGYQEGYENSERYTEGYADGFDVGKANGYSEGYAVGIHESGSFNFGSILKAVVDSPIYFLQSLFGWSLFGEGETMATIIITLITALVFVALLKKVF